MTYNEQNLDQPYENTDSMTTSQGNIDSESISMGTGLDEEANVLTIESTTTGADLPPAENSFTLSSQPIALPPASDMNLPLLGSGSTSIGAGLATDENTSANSPQPNAQPKGTESVSNTTMGTSDAVKGAATGSGMNPGLARALMGQYCSDKTDPP